MLLRIARNGSLLCLIVLPLAGCSLFGGDKLEECRSESEQLLSDYRRQRDRAERLELQNRTLQQQVAEAEKQLARTSQQQAERLAQRTPDEKPSPPDRPAGSSEASPPATATEPAPPPQPSTSTPPEASGDVSSAEPAKPIEDGWRSIPQQER